MLGRHGGEDRARIGQGRRDLRQAIGHERTVEAESLGDDGVVGRGDQAAGFVVRPSLRDRDERGVEEAIAPPGAPRAARKPRIFAPAAGRRLDDDDARRRRIGGDRIHQAEHALARPGDEGDAIAAGSPQHRAPQAAI